MTAREFRAMLALLDLTQSAFARLVSADIKTVNSWACGRAAVPAWVLVLLTALTFVKDLPSFSKHFHAKAS